MLIVVLYYLLPFPQLAISGLESKLTTERENSERLGAALYVAKEMATVPRQEYPETAVIPSSAWADNAPADMTFKVRVRDYSVLVDASSSMRLVGT